MNFELIRDALTSVLEAESSARYFRVVGSQRQVKDAEDVKASRRLVQVFYSRGDFSKTGGRNTGPVNHSMNFNITLTVSAPAKIDLNVINNPAATATQRATALSALLDASDQADRSWDELARHVFQIIMDGRNYDLGLDKGVITSRWVGSVQKDSPAPEGSLVVLTGVVQYSCVSAEQIPGEVGTVSESILTTLEANN